MLEDVFEPLPKASQPAPCKARRCWLRPLCPLGTRSALPPANGAGSRTGSSSWCQPGAKSPPRRETFVLRAGRRAEPLGSEEDVRALSYYSLQLHLCLKLWIKTCSRGLQRITDKFCLCAALIFFRWMFLFISSIWCARFRVPLIKTLMSVVSLLYFSILCWVGNRHLRTICQRDPSAMCRSFRPVQG